MTLTGLSTVRPQCCTMLFFSRVTSSNKRKQPHLEMILGEPLRSGHHITAEVLSRRHAVQVFILQRNDLLFAYDVTRQRTWNTDSAADVEVCGDATGLLQPDFGLPSSCCSLLHCCFVLLMVLMSWMRKVTPWSTWSLLYPLPFTAW